MTLRTRTKKPNMRTTPIMTATGTIPVTQTTLKLGKTGLMMIQRAAYDVVHRQPL